MSWTAPTPADFKSFFARDFNFAPVDNPNNIDLIMDSDITRAINEALINFNSCLFGSDAQSTNVFMYLAAYMLVCNLQTSAQGLASQSKFPISSTNVGSVSVSFQIPDAYSKDPYFSAFSRNGYGMKYLELVWPFLIGNVQIFQGGTT